MKHVASRSSLRYGTAMLGASAVSRTSDGGVSGTDVVEAGKDRISHLPEGGNCAEWTARKARWIWTVL